ncbi:hypothetical protein MPDQ_002826 [Monascus purpureus]|uniref:Uncharacterized protein n=1 Tax=Monascus purpureus TaxID=5098 RepID=A0A507QNT7_MONPU|nr:hypothetical protein MPDQ_002826 [Monascus purpureus]
MTIFIASLFLPQTVNFHVDGHHNSNSLRGSRYPSFSHFPFSSRFPRDSINTASNTPASLFEPPKVPQTPTLTGGKADHEHIFSHAIAETGKKPSEAQLLTDSEFPSPKWGYTTSLNQPKPQTTATPSPSILKHADPLFPQPLPTDERTKTVPQLIRQEPTREQSFSSAEWTVERAEQGNGGLRNAVRAASDAGYLENQIWVGTLGMPTDALIQDMKDSIAKKMEEEYGSLTVYVNDSDFDGHYTHFCKTILWPVLHYQIPDNPKSKAYEDHSWIYYVKVNQEFAECIARNWKKGDSVWIHDYHLLLVPAMLRKLLPEGADAKIGFFLHIAFPSSEVFRCLAPRKQLLEGMLGSNLIGFQSDEYCRHFLQTCSRILCVEATNEGVQLEDRFVNVGKFPIGIDPASLEKRRNAGDVDQWAKMISQRYAGKKLIVSRDKMDQIRGIRQKLLSYELFLNTYPDWADKVVLIQVATTTTEQPELEVATSEIATRINSTHSTLTHQPLVFLKQDLAFSQYLALISVADALMVTSLREGMNLTSHEFVYCQNGKYDGKGYGSLILSEFTGSASVFGNHALLVNPWDYRQCSEAIHTALTRSLEERKEVWTELYSAVLSHSTTNWVKSFSETLDKVWKEQSARETTAVPRLYVTALEERYKKSCRRFIIVDYEGTLAAWGSPNNIILTTPQRAISVLNDLTEDPKNVVYVMSSRMPQEMERLFQRVTNLGLIAENGCYVREPNAEEWATLVDEDKTQIWKEAVSQILCYFQERTEGSWVEQLHCSFIFHYEKAEDEAAAARLASECADQINDACSNQGVHAVRIERAIVVETTTPNKGSAAELVWSNYLEKGENDPEFYRPDFLLVIGDDREDEPVFRWANSLESSKAVDFAKTVTLGSRSTEAKATLKQGVTGVLACLQRLAGSPSEGRIV